ncbi:tetratricopeptide repeat protein [Alteromonas sp. 5E99-2]|uniref:VWA domain-containing protein n=1 Tax=Alteromonas sp. 5E99-2 TaxID=2817683 RepID=UPI001A9A14A6|nr:VWA domain-containing protein [Alteromonas sp. 5E99-2]MBO1256080.1 tetratricopeptide repeat protein [Alteromonas sp. 5E99-2]
MLNDFHFLRPEWLYALIPLILVWILVNKFPKNQQDWQGVISPHLYKHLFPTSQKNINLLGLAYALTFALALGVIGAAGPTVEKLPQPVFSVDKGHVVVMDMSLSMRSTDIAPDRLTRAKFKAIDLVQLINEGEIGLVAYAGDAFTISPLTEDISTLETLIPSLSPEIMPVRGSDAYAGLTLAADLLLQAGYPNGTIYWITDGIDIREAKDISEWINQSSFQINVLAVGTKEGAPITQANGELFKDYSGSIVIPKLNVGPLVAVAKQSSGAASEITTDDSDIKRITSAVVPPSASDDEEEEKLGGDQWRELGPWLVILALPFVAYLFRRGLIAVMVLTFSSTVFYPHPSFANDADISVPSKGSPNSVTSWFKNKDQRGLDAYKNKDYEDAANEFNDPMWQGSAHYRQGNYEEAISSFSQLDSADAWYNTGNALAQLGKLDEAIEAYGNALSRDPGYSAAEQNKALVESLKEQQEQEQQNDENSENNQDQNGENSEDNQQDDSQSEGQEESQGDNQDSNQDNGQSDEQQEDSEGNPSDPQQNGENESENSEQPQESEENSQQQSEESPEFNDEESREGEQADEGNDQGEELEQQKAVQNAQINESSLTDEEREKQQKIEALLRRVPNDPAFLLQQKMRLEAQKRAGKTRSAPQEKQW